MVRNLRNERRFSFGVRVKRSAQPPPSGAGAKAGDGEGLPATDGMDGGRFRPRDVPHEEPAQLPPGEPSIERPATIGIDLAMNAFRVHGMGAGGGGAPAALGHDVRRMPASCVRPCVKRGRTDKAAAEARPARG